MTNVSAARVATFSLAGAALLLVGLHARELGYVAGDLLANDPGRLYRRLLYLATDFAHAAFAAFIAWKVDRHGVLLGALYFAAGSFARTFGGVAGDSVWLSVLWAVTLGFCGAGAIRFAQLFPRAIARNELPLRSATGRFQPTHVLLRFMLLPAAAWVVAIGADVTNALLLPDEWGAWGNMLRNLLVAGTALLFVRISYLSADEAERRKIYWIMQGILMILVATILNLMLRTTPFRIAASVVFMLGQLALVLCVAFAVFYTGAIDPRLVVQRTALVSAVTGATVVLFVTVEAVLTNVFVTGLGATNGRASVVAGIVAALAFRKIHGVIEPRVQRWLPGSRPLATHQTGVPAGAAAQ